ATRSWSAKARAARATPARSWARSPAAFSATPSRTAAARPVALCWGPARAPWPATRSPSTTPSATATTSGATTEARARTRALPLHTEPARRVEIQRVGLPAGDARVHQAAAHRRADRGHGLVVQHDLLG